MNNFNKLADRLTEVIAVQLYYFEYPINSASEAALIMNNDKIFERYRNDYVFHAKVTSMVASVMRVVSEWEEA